MGAECCLQNYQREFQKWAPQARLKPVLPATLESLIKDEAFARRVQKKRQQLEYSADLTSKGRLVEKEEDGLTVYYMGQHYENGRLTGQGSLLNRKGLTVGTFKDGVPLQGVTFLRNGGQFRGEYGGMEPLKGVYLGKGTRYEGEFRNSQPEGEGFQTNGEYEFRGRFRAGEMVEGRYTFSRLEPASYFQGRLRDNLPDSQGAMFLDGQTVTRFRLDTAGRLCFGHIEYENKDTYFGEIADGMRHGRGEYRSAGQVYRGEYARNHRHGHGVLETEGRQFNVAYCDGELTQAEERT